MHKTEQSKDRRRYQRYTIRDDAFAMVTPLSAKRSEIIDISKGGLAMRYVPGNERARISTEVDLFLNIFLRDISFCLLRLPVRTISDTPERAVEKDGKTRRRSVQFGTLTQNQENELETFINKHTGA